MTQRWGADAVLVFITAVWGLTFIVVHEALADADPFTFLALRFGVGAVALSLVCVRALRDLSLWGPGLLLGGLLFAGYAFQTWGLLFTTPSRSAFITGMSVLLVPPFSVVLSRRRLPLPSVLGALISALGLAVFTGVGGEVALASGATWRGDALTLGCALGFAIHIVLTERFSRGRSAPALVAVQLWVVALLSVLMLPFVTVRLALSTGLWGAVLLCGVVASAFAIGMQTWAQARTTSVRASLIFASEPAFAALFAYFLRGQALTSREWMGGSLILLAIAVAEVGNAFWARRRDVVVGL